MYVSTCSYVKHVLKREEKTGFDIGSEPGTSCTYFSTWIFPGMFVAHTHSLEIQQSWILSIQIETTV